MGEGIRKDVANATSCLAEKRLQLLYADLAGPMPASTGGIQCWLTIVDDPKMDWLVVLPDKSTGIVTHGFRIFLATVNASGKSACLHAENTSELTKNEFRRLITDTSIRCECTTVDGPKPNGRVEWKLALVGEVGKAAFMEFRTVFDGVEFAVKAPNYGRTWPETWTWKRNALNLMTRADKKPGITWSVEDFHGRPYRAPTLPYMMPGRDTVIYDVQVGAERETLFLPESRERLRL